MTPFVRTPLRLWLLQSSTKWFSRRSCLELFLVKKGGAFPNTPYKKVGGVRGKNLYNSMI
jgi:hypothetical protein